MIYESRTKDEIIVNCDCGCGSGLLWQAASWDGEGKKFYLSLVEHSFYAKQTGRFSSYVKRLWNALRGKEYRLTEIILNRSEAEEFKEFLHRLLLSGG